MRSYPEDDYEKKELEELNAKDWQINLLKVNPEYVYWGNFEDYMLKTGGGWDSRMEFDHVGEGLWGLNELNECVHFYFDLYRPQIPCEHCGETGMNPETRRIADDWYDFNRTGRKWCDKITQHEVDALWEHSRLKHDFAEKPTAEQVNNWERSRTMGHDAINRNICVRARAEREGVYGDCEYCNGNGYIFTEPNAKIGLQLWILHPRKGCSRGVWIKEVREEDLPTVKKWLTEAAERNAERFARIESIA